jgi:branched-chain amino acid transport system ATP-binding protein
MSALEVRDVTVRFGGNVALDQAALTAEPSAVTGLIGPNGAGKTTLFNVICGLLTPQRGRVLVEGRDVTRLATHKRARLGMARTFQRLELFGLMSVHDNVRLAAAVAGAGDPDEVASGLLERVNLAGEASTRADQLPTGRARRVELARALACEPRVLLLDEPASGQDESETEEFSRLVRDIADDGVAVVLVEHDMQLVMGVCDTIHVLDFGRIIAVGPPEAVREDAAVQAAYLGTGVGA